MARCFDSGVETMSKSDLFSFEEQKQFGNKWESELSDRLESVLTQAKIENISFTEQPEVQRNGIDAVMHDEEPDFDVKTQSYKHRNTGNLPIETWSVWPEKPGWFYAADSDIIAWVYENQAGNNLLSTGYFMLKDDWLVKWFNDRIEDFREVFIPNEGYETVVRLVPIEVVPDTHITEFNPTLTENKDTEQYELSSFDSAADGGDPQ